MKRFLCLAGLLASPAIFAADDLQNCRLAGSRLEKGAPELSYEFLPNNLPTNSVKAKKGGQLFSWDSYKVLAPVVSVTTPISGLICHHEPEDFVALESLRLANQAVAFAKMSRSVCNCLT